MRRILVAAVALALAVIPVWRVGTAHAFWAHMHYWSADGTTADMFGGPSATFAGGAGFGPGYLSSQAFSFPGTSSSSASFGSAVGNYGSGDFSVGFELKTAQTGVVAVVNKRPICNYSNFWDIRLLNGHVVGELDQGTNGADYALLQSVATVNDGQWHRISFARSGLRVYLEIDGLVDTQTTMRVIPVISNASPLLAGADVCDGIDGTVPLNGEIDNLFVGSST